MGKTESKVPAMPLIEIKPEPKVGPNVKPNKVLASSEIYIEWNDRQNEIRVDGKLSNSSQKDEFISVIKNQFKSAIITPNLIVDKDNVEQAGNVLELDSYLPMIIKAHAGNGSVKIVDHPASLTLNGTLKSKADFNALNRQLEPLLKSSSEKPLKMINNLKYRPVFVIEKDDKKREVILSGYANRNDSVNLSSYIKRFTKDAKNQYEFKSDIVPEKRSVEYRWTDTDQKLLDNQLKNVVRGKIYYENDLVTKVTGVTTDAAYQKTLVDRFLNTGTRVEMTHDEKAKPQTPMKETPADQSALATVRAKAEAEKVQIQATNKLKTEVKEYKIYFDSGRKDVAAKYDPLIRALARTILKSEDKKSVIVIGGFADHTGNPVSNEKLSKERAASVQVKLVELGVPITRTVVEFFGAESTDVDKKLSRRVEIRVR